MLFELGLDVWILYANGKAFQPEDELKQGGVKTHAKKLRVAGR